LPAAAAALERADAILLGPGSLYTSILPNLLIPGIRQAIAKSKAPVILLLNLMTQPGETDGMMGPAHLAAVQRYLGADAANIANTADGRVDMVLASSTAIPPHLLTHYAETGSSPVAVERETLERMGARVVETDLLAPGELIRHDSDRLAATVLDLLEKT
jgi:uncharacterized cofD-like protein